MTAAGRTATVIAAIIAGVIAGQIAAFGIKKI